MAKEMLVADGKVMLSFEGRVLEIFGMESDFSQRIHIDALKVLAKGPDKHGNTVVKLGVGWKRAEDGILGNVTKFELTAMELERFERFYAAVKTARVDGPEPF